MSKKNSSPAKTRNIRTADDGIDRRLRIIEAAAQAFMRQGFASTSIDDIARLLGCTKGLIYYHFKNKTELFFAVHRHTIEINLGNIRPLAQGEGSPQQKMRAMVRRHIDSIIENMPFQRVTLMGLEMQIIGSTTPEERLMLDELIQMYHKYEGLFVQVIKDGVAAGEFASGDARVMVKPLLGAMNWMIMWYRPRAEGRVSIDKLRDGMVTSVLRGLAP